MKKLLFIGLFIILSVECAFGESSGCIYNFNDTNDRGDAQYPYEGYIYVYAQRSYPTDGVGGTPVLSYYYNTFGNTVYYKFVPRVYSSTGYGAQGSAYVDYDSLMHYECISDDSTCSKSECFYYTSSGDRRIGAYAGFNGAPASVNAYGCLFVKVLPFLELTVTGDTCGVTGVDLYLKDTTDTYYLAEEIVLDPLGDNYLFNITEEYTYKITFSDGHEYIFTPDTTHIIYNYDICSYYTLNIVDDCANTVINPYTTIYRNDFIPFLLYQGYENPINLVMGTDIELGDDIDITIHTCDGDIMLHDPYVEERVRNIFHRDISWDLDITCEDDNTGAKLHGVKVIRTQDCCIIGEPSGYALTQSNGKVCFTGLANSNIGVSATKDGYVDYNNTISVGNCFNCQSQGAIFTIYMNATSGESTDDYNNGTHNDSENVDGTGEETLPSEHGFGCGVYFKNTDGYIVSSIYDTDAYVDMYWWVKNHGDGDSNLKFQYQLYTHWYTAQAYTVSNNTYERRRIYNTDFNDHTNSYRGYIYNETEGCNDVQILRVLNHTYENETNYRNLTSHCHFMHKLGGNQIDYRSNVKIKIYANSDNSTLLNITANFMNGSTLEDSITYNWADFVNGDPKWWVVWEPDYAYTSGYNYTVNTTGFDGYQLDTDEVWTADIVGSELTVFVLDNYNHQVAHSTVFVEGWGSISTGDKYYVSIAGFPQGTYQYKATKAGYISSGWASIDLDSHESVTCILVSETQTSITASKMTNAEIKAFFIPLMYLLLIMMLLGAFKFACGGK